MTANPARLIAAAALKDASASWNVVSAPRPLDAVVRDTVLVWTGKLARTSYQGGTYISSTVEVWLLPAGQDGPRFEDRADDMLTTALQAIEASSALTWDEADRGVLADQWHGWHITLTIAHHLTKE